MSCPRLEYITLFIIVVLSGVVLAEPAYANRESITPDRVELELYMKCGCPDGASLAGVRIEGMDASNTPFDVTTDGSGYAVIYGTPGLWQFIASKEGFKTNSWTMQVTQDDKKYPYLLNDNTNWISKVDTSERLPTQELALLVMEKFTEGDVPGREGESIRATAYAVARAESGGNPTAWGDRKLGDSIGLWQINLCWHPEYSASELFDPDYNANAALEISKNGLDWTPWSTWKDGTYKVYLEEGQDELNQLSGIRSKVTLTLYVHDGSASGPIIQGSQVTGRDGSGNSFEQTTDISGYVTITGYPGTWSFSVSADGYETNSWDQEITKTDTKDAYLQITAGHYSLSNEESLTPEKLKAITVESLNKNFETVSFAVDENTNGIDRTSGSMVFVSTSTSGVMNVTARVIKANFTSIEHTGEVSNGEIYVQGDYAYAKAYGIWGKVPVSEDEWNSLVDMIRSKAELLTAFDIEMVGLEKVNGEDAYTLKLVPNMDVLISILSQQSEPISPFTSIPDLFEDSKIERRIWIAKESHYFLKDQWTIEMTLTPDDVLIPIDEMGDTVDVKFSSTEIYTKYNEPVVIEVPEEALEASLIA